MQKAAGDSAGCQGKCQQSGIAARGDFSGQQEGRDGLLTRSRTMAGCLSPATPTNSRTAGELNDYWDDGNRNASADSLVYICRLLALRGPDSFPNLRRLQA